MLHGKEGVRFDRSRRARTSRARAGAAAGPGRRRRAAALHEHRSRSPEIHRAGIFGDSLQGGAVALDPKTGEVLALYSAPSCDPNRFTGGIPADYYKQLRNDPRRPLVQQGDAGTLSARLDVQARDVGDRRSRTAWSGRRAHAGAVHRRLPVRQSLLALLGEARATAASTLAGAIAQSCDVYFYQLGLKIGLAQARSRADRRSRCATRSRHRSARRDISRSFPTSESNYFNKKYGPRGWSNAETLNLAIGQGENSQTVVNMAKFYSALATDGTEPRAGDRAPRPQRKQIFRLSRRAARNGSAKG